MNSNLLSITNEYKAQYFKKLANRLARKSEKGMIVTNAKLFDFKIGKVAHNATIVIESGIIKEVLKGKTVKAPKG